MRSAPPRTILRRALGRTAAALLLTLGLLSGGRAHAMSQGCPCDDSYDYYYYYRVYAMSLACPCPSYYNWDPPPVTYDPPPEGVTQFQLQCRRGYWRLRDGSTVSGSACLQPDGTWRGAY